jgi:hypothetical protein
MISDYIGSHSLRGRRDSALTVGQRYEIAIEALSAQNYSYAKREIFRLWMAAKFGYRNTVKTSIITAGYPKRSVICSQLYSDSFVRVTNRTIGNIVGGEVTPASLSAEASLSDVSMHWLSIP